MQHDWKEKIIREYDLQINAWVEAEKRIQAIVHQAVQDLCLKRREALLKELKE